MSVLDVALHGGIAAAIVWILGFAAAHWQAALLASTGFFLREVAQAFERTSWLVPWHWSNQKLAEAYVPIIASVLVATVWHYIHRRRAHVR